MKKSNLLYIIVIFAVLLVLQNLLILRSVAGMSGDARVVNYSGLVRGATQRLIKLEITHNPNDALMGRLDDFIYGLAGYENSHDIQFMEYEPFQASIADLLVIWDELKEAVFAYREGNISAEALLEVSERHFAKADEATGNAEVGSEGKVRNARLLIIVGLSAITVIIIIAVIFLYALRRSDKHQLELLSEKNFQLEAAILEANEASRAKSQFLSSMSHDIRTPLNGIIGMTTIASGNLTNYKKMQDCLRKIEHSSKHLQSLVNDVLDMSKIESGKFVLNNSEIFLPEFTEMLINIIQQQIKAKKQDLNVALFSVSHERVMGDQLRLNQLFVNILSNSVKFTPVGGTVGIILNELPCPREGHARFQFVCYDTGIGMSEEFMKHIFESFSRERDSRIDKIEGSGLGMSITKRIVEMMEGDIKVESEKDKGSKFTITLDLPICADGDLSEDPGDLKGLRVLVVDDDEMSRMSMEQVLGELGALATIKSDAEETLAALAGGEDFDAAIIDWKMPGVDGAELCKKIRKDARRNFPIFVSSAYDWIEIEAEALASGVNGFITKPLFKSALLLKMREALSPGGQSEARSSLSAGLRLDGVRVLLAEDNELNTEIAVEILGQSGLIVDCAADGKECVEMFGASVPGTYSMILMDMQMPVMTGCEAATAIRKSSRKDASVIPIIAMTANAFEDDIREALESGMNAHVAKPVNFETLKLVMHKFLPKQIKKEEPQKEETVAPEVLPDSLLEAIAPYGVNTATGLARFAGNKKIYENCLIKFTKDSSYSSLDSAVHAEDFDGALRAAHTLKGIAANLSMDVFAESVLNVELALKQENINGALINFRQVKDLYEALIEVIGKYEA